MTQARIQRIYQLNHDVVISPETLTQGDRIYLYFPTTEEAQLALNGIKNSIETIELLLPEGLGNVFFDGIENARIMSSGRSFCFWLTLEQNQKLEEYSDILISSSQLQSSQNQLRAIPRTLGEWKAESKSSARAAVPLPSAPSRLASKLFKGTSFKLEKNPPAAIYEFKAKTL